MLLVLAACTDPTAKPQLAAPAARSAAAERSDWFSRRPALSTKHASDGAGHVPCAPIRACAQRVAAGGYSETLQPALERCAGGSERAVTDAQDCFPVPIGTDRATGLRLWASIFWSNSCVDPGAGVGAAFADVGSPDECACVGGVWSHPWCVPRSSTGQPTFTGNVELIRDRGEPAPPWFFDTSMQRHRQRRRWVFLRPPPPQLAPYGVHQGDAIVEIDGDRVSSPDQVLALVRRLPDGPPHRLVVESVRVDRSREIHFVDRATMQTLAQRMPAPEAWNERTRCNAGNCFWLNARVDAINYAIYFDPKSAEGVRWAMLAGEIGRVIDTEIVPVAPSPDPIACMELRTLPTLLALSQPDGSSRELRYVDAFTRPHKLQVQTAR